MNLDNENTNEMNKIRYNKINNKVDNNIIKLNIIKSNLEGNNDNKTMETHHSIYHKVINISAYELKNEEIEVLNKGLNFALSPNRIPKEEIICT